MRSPFVHTPDDLASVVQLGTTTESLYLDFKKTIDNWNLPSGVPNRQQKVQDAQKETCRDIAQFANTEGGCLVIGVNERKEPTTGIKVATSISGLQASDQMQQWIERAIRNYLVPATFSHEVSIIKDPRGTVIAVNVPPSRYLVALWDYSAHTIEYMQRTSYGKGWMNPETLMKWSDTLWTAPERPSWASSRQETMLGASRLRSRVGCGMNTQVHPGDVNVVIQTYPSPLAVWKNTGLSCV